jgi:hypothetical protein
MVAWTLFAACVSLQSSEIRFSLLKRVLLPTGIRGAIFSKSLSQLKGPANRSEEFLAQDARYAQTPGTRRPLSRGRCDQAVGPLNRDHDAFFNLAACFKAAATSISVSNGYSRMISFGEYPAWLNRWIARTGIRVPATTQALCAI